MKTIDDNAIYSRISDHACTFDITIIAEEIVELVVRCDMGEPELNTLETAFAYLADKHRNQMIGTLLKLNHLS